MTERPPAEDELLVDDGDDADGAGQLGLPLTIDLEPGSTEPTPARPAGDQRARFVAESQPLGSDGALAAEPGDDDLTLAFVQVDPDDRGSHSTVRLRRIPPALPASLRPPAPPPKVLLGPELSMRNEITERVPLIPKTHPMANSLAPGGSPLSMPPAKRASRGLLVAGAAALLALGVGAAHYLQSRGEHHAATDRDDGGRHAAVQAVTHPMATDVTREAEPPTEAVAVRDEHAPPVAPTATVAAVARPEIARSAPQAEPPKATSAIPAAVRPGATAIQPAEPALKLAVGEAAIRPAQRPFRPTLGALTAGIDAVRDQVRACAGETHGIADVVLTIQSTGAITHALVQSGPFADSPAGSCIARTMRKVRVAPFTKPVAHVLYSLRL